LLAHDLVRRPELNSGVPEFSRKNAPKSDKSDLGDQVRRAGFFGIMRQPLTPRLTRFMVRRLEHDPFRLNRIML
jgi:hypothetical protein